MSDKLNTAYVSATMRQRLGGSRRSVELTEDDYVEAIEQALDLWNQYRSRTEFHRQDNVTTAEAAPYSIALDSCVIGVRNVQFLVPYNESVASLNIFELTEKLAITRLGVKDIALTRTAWKMYRGVRGVEPRWHFDAESDPKKLVFFAPGGPYTVGYELILPFTDPVQIEQDRDNMFLKACEGYCRRILGEIRGKFGNNVLGPDGRSVQLDADFQRTQAEKLITEVEDLLKISRPNAPVPFRF